MSFEKPLGPNGTVITMALGKAGSRQGRPNQEILAAKVNTLCEKVVQKLLFGKPQKFGNGTKI